MSKSAESIAGEAFWFVARLDHFCTPKVRHGNFESARAEAMRLAQQVPGTEFYVAKSVVSYATPSPIPLVETTFL